MARPFFSAASTCQGSRIFLNEHATRVPCEFARRTSSVPPIRGRVANSLSDDITIIDAKTRKATISIPVGRIPWGVIIDE